MNKNYNINTNNHQINFNQGSQHLTSDSYEKIKNTIYKYVESKNKTSSFVQYVKSSNKYTQNITENLLNEINGCGSWLEFRNYYEVDKTKLHNANFCKKDKLCPACAMRRASKQVKKVYDYFQSNQSLKSKYWYYIVLPVKHNSTEDFETVFNRARNGLKSLKMSIRDNKRGKGKKSFFSQFDGFFYSFEVTKTKNGWNNHINLLCCSDKKITGIYKKGNTYIHNDIVRDWSKYTDNQSYIHSINEIDVSNDDSLIKNLLEIFKYSLKFQDLSHDDLIEVYEKTYRKRLLGSTGCLYGLKLDVNLDGDDVLGNKFLEIIYRYNFKTKEYYEYSRQIKEVDCKNRSFGIHNYKYIDVSSFGKVISRVPIRQKRKINICDSPGAYSRYNDFELFQKTMSMVLLQ